MSHIVFRGCCSLSPSSAARALLPLVVSCSGYCLLLYFSPSRLFGTHSRALLPRRLRRTAAQTQLRASITYCTDEVVERPVLFASELHSNNILTCHGTGRQATATSRTYSFPQQWAAPRAINRRLCAARTFTYTCVHTMRLSAGHI